MVSIYILTLSSSYGFRKDWQKLYENVKDSGLRLPEIKSYGHVAEGITAAVVVGLGFFREVKVSLAEADKGLEGI